MIASVNKFSITKKTKLSGSEVIYNKNYSLPVKIHDLITETDGIKGYNKDKLFKIHIQPKVN